MELYNTSDINLVNENIDKIIDSIESRKKELFPDSKSKPEPIKSDESIVHTSSEIPISSTETKPHDATTPDSAIVKLTLEFVEKKKRKIYGGYAQNEVVKNKNPDDAFYKFDDVPDIDVYSPDPIVDLTELCNILFTNGYTDTIGKEAMHKETYKIFVNGYNAIDLSYVPKLIYDNIPFIEIHKIRYVNPSFAMIDLYRIMSEPLFSSWRWKKVFSRLYLLQKHFPFANINDKIQNIYKHKKNVTTGLNIVSEFIKNNPSVYVFGDFAYNQFVKESKIKNKNISIIDVNLYQIISTNYKQDVEKLVSTLKNSKINISIIEYYPFCNFTGFSVEIMCDGEVIAKMYNHLKRCCPIKKINIDNKIVQIGSFDYILLMEMVLSFRQKVLNDKNKKKYHDTIISNLIKMRKHYFERKHKTLLDDSLFQSFISSCIGEAVDPMAEAKKLRKEKKANKSSSFFYKPIRELKNKWIFANTSGNAISNPKNLKFKIK